MMYQISQADMDRLNEYDNAVKNDILLRKVWILDTSCSKPKDCEGDCEYCDGNDLEPKSIIIKWNDFDKSRHYASFDDAVNAIKTKSNISKMFGVPYGTNFKDKSGIVTNIATLPDKTFFRVENGGWLGYVEQQSNYSTIYCGVNSVNPTEKYSNKIIVKSGDAFDALITIIKENK